jgi:hypothetical protein
MPTRNVNPTEHFDSFSNAGEAEGEELRLLQTPEQDEEAKLEWLRAAAREGFDAIERGDYVTLRSGKEIDAFIDELRIEASEELAAEIARG